MKLPRLITTTPKRMRGMAVSRTRLAGPITIPRPAPGTPTRTVPGPVRPETQPVPTRPRRIDPFQPPKPLAPPKPKA